MGWDGAGGYNRIHNFSADASAGINILAARMDAELDDFASALTRVWTRDGQNAPTQDLTLGGRKFIGVGAATSVNNYMRVREFIENVPIFMQDQESSADRISVSAQFFTSVSANQAPGDGTRILVRAGSDKSSAVLYLNGHSANVEFQDGNRAGDALVSGGIYEFLFSSVDVAWKVTRPDDGRTAAERSAGVTIVNHQKVPGNVLRYGHNTTPGTTDMAPAIQAAIDTAEAGGVVYVPSGTYLIGSQLSIADGTPIKFCGDGPKSIIRKGFNGDMLSLGLKSELTGVYLDGNGANFTGRGVIIETGSGGDGWQNIHDCTILDTQSYCIEYTAVGAGWMSRIVNVRLGVYNRPATYAIKYPADPGGTDNGPRLISNCVTLGPLVDIAGSKGCNIIGNMAGEDASQTVPSVTMNSDSVRAVAIGNTFECNTPVQIKGDRHVFIANVMRDGYSLEAGATNCIVGFTYTTGSIDDLDVDNSSSVTNMMYSAAHTYTPTWTGSGSNPAIGNGTISGRWQRDGRRVHLQIDLLMGSTTTFGTGTYTFSLPTVLPAPGSGTSVGTCWMFDSGTTNRVGTAIIDGSGVVCIADSEAANVGATNPFTWAANDRLRIDATYNL